jgi:hypothetical protein
MLRTDWGRRLTLLFSLKKAEVCGQVYLLCVINLSALFTAFFQCIHFDIQQRGIAIIMVIIG